MRFWKPLFLEQAPETARANINLGILKPISIPVPPLALQREFSNRVQAERDLQAVQAKSARLIEAFYQSILSRAFAGEC